MKNKLFLLALSKLFNLDVKVIETALENEAGDDSIIKGFTDKYTSYTIDDLAKLIKNSNEQYLEKADFEITKVPQGLYSKIVGAAMEKKEKTLAKEHNIAEYKDLSDLLTKIVESKSGKGLDDTAKGQIETLKGTIKTLEQEKTDAVANERKKFDTILIGTDFSSALSSLPLDYDAEAKEKQIKLLSAAFNSEFTLERKGEKTIVLGKDGKPKNDKLGEPLALLDVLKPFTQEYGFKLKAEDQGGRGTGNSQEKQTLKGKTFEEAVAMRGVKPMTDESDKLMLEWQAENPKQ